MACRSTRVYRWRAGGFFLARAAPARALAAGARMFVTSQVPFFPMTPHYRPIPPAGTTGASLSRFWAVSGPGGGRTQPRPITALQPFLGAMAPMHGQPNICATEGAPGVPSSMVLKYIHSVSATPSILVLTVSEPFLSRFSSRFWDFDRF
jgi:hypothetical protein